MPWKTQLFASHAAWVAAHRPVGGVMPVPAADRENRDAAWPDRYKTATAYYVALPTGQLWCPWQKAYAANQGYHGDGWAVSGPPERLTVSPSIAVPGYHGHLRDGEITDDVEGRTFPRRTIMEDQNTSAPAADQRAAIDEQLLTLSKAEETGALPVTDRRAPDPATEVDMLDASDEIEHVDDDDIAIVTKDPDSAAKQLIAHVGVPAARAFLEAMTRQLGPSATTTEGRDAALQTLADASAAPPKLVQVETIAEGFDGTKFRTIGERFVIEERKLGKWMRRIETDVVAKVESL